MNQIPEILTTENLQEITGYDRPRDVERCLRDQGVRFFKGRNGPWTTVDLVNAAGGLVQYRPQDNVEIL